MILLISLNKKLFNLENLGLMKRDVIDHPLYQHMEVFSQHISIYTEEKYTIGAVVVILRTDHGAMDNASGS